jgi:hypothetical protein
MMIELKGDPYASIYMPCAQKIKSYTRYPIALLYSPVPDIFQS